MAAPMRKLVSENLLRCNLLKGLTWSRLLVFYQRKQFTHSETYILDNGQTEEKNKEMLHERAVPTSKLGLYQKFLMQPDQPPNAKILRVAIIGAPNAGKSTLMNQLTKWKVSAVSKKVNCTRKNTLSVYTKDDTQILFVDTPGARNPFDVKNKRLLEKSMIIDPLRSLDEADLVTVLVDAENKWTRNQLNEDVLKILHLNPKIPSILVLNKCDIVKNKEVLLQVTDILTQGVVDGQKIKTDTKNLKQLREKQKNDKIKNLFDRYENYLKDKQKKDKPQNDERYLTYHTSGLEERLKELPNEANAQTYSDNDDIHSESCSQESLTELENELNTSNLDEQSEPIKGSKNSEIDGKEDENSETSKTDYTEYTKRLKTVSPTEAGWPNFSDVFMISAIDGDGVDELENYLLNQAKPGDWEYHSSFVTDIGPYELAKSCVWEKILDHLPYRLPYLLYPEITDWDVNADDTLCITMKIETANDHECSQVIGRSGSTIQQISKEAQQELLNAFRREVILSLQVRVKVNPKRRKRWSN